MLDVLCVGEALWDLHGPPDTSFAEAPALRLRPGGAAVNVALRLARRGYAVGLAAAVGADALGEALAARVAARGVDVTHVASAPHRTGVVFVEHGARGRRIVGYRDADEAGPRLSPAWRARVLFLTGLAPSPGHAASLVEAARDGRRQRAIVVVDVNARPRLWRGRSPETALATLALLGDADVVKASADDLATMGLRAQDVRARLRADAVLILTCGAELASAEGAFGMASRAPRVLDVADALGAGDAFSTGVLRALLEAGCAVPSDAAAWEGVLARGHAVASALLRRRG